jgi:hypothetical protein
MAEPPSDAEFLKWLSPGAALKRLPADWSARTKRNAIIRGIQDRSLVALTRTGTIRDDHGTRPVKLVPIAPQVWDDPWVSEDRDFWTAGDIEFWIPRPTEVLFFAGLDRPPEDERPVPKATYRDVRIEPASFEREFAGHLQPDFREWLSPKEALASVPSEVDESQRRKWIMRRLREGKIVAAAEQVTLADMQGERIVLNVIIERQYWGWYEDGDWFDSGDLDVSDMPEPTSAGPRQSLDAWRYGPKKHGPTVHKTALFLGVRLDPAGFPRPKVEAKGGKIPEAEFETWLHPVDVIEWYHQQGEREPKALIITLLSEGILQAAARQLIVNGKDLGIAPIAKEIWKAIGWSDWWQTQRFHMSTGAIGGPSITGLGVRIKPEEHALPGPDDAKEAAPAPSPEPSPAPPQQAARAPSFKAGRGPSDDEILAKADEMRTRGLSTYAIAKGMRLEPGFEYVATRDVRELIKGRYPRTGRAGIKE